MTEFVTTFVTKIDFQVAYLLVVTCGSLTILFFGLSKLKSAEKQRLQSINKMDVTEAVEIESLDEDIESITRKRAASSVEARFVFIRKIFVPSILSILIFLVAFPFLPTLSASYVSLFAGIIAVLIGIAAKPLIENAISGVVITLSQPIRINDTVIIDGKYGTIEKITLLYTVIKVWNWRRYIIPNHKLLQKEFENLSQSDEYEWAHIEFRVAPGSDLQQVKKLAKESMNCPYLWKTEKPSFWVMDLQSDTILCWVAGWAKTPAEAWALKSHARRQLATQLTKAGIKFHLNHNKIDIEHSQRLTQ